MAWCEEDVGIFNIFSSLYKHRKGQLYSLGKLNPWRHFPCKTKADFQARCDALWRFWAFHMSGVLSQDKTIIICTNHLVLHFLHFSRIALCCWFHFINPLERFVCQGIFWPQKPPVVSEGFPQAWIQVPHELEGWWDVRPIGIGISRLSCSWGTWWG